MEWFKVKTNFFIHRKKHKLRAALGQKHAEIYVLRILGWLAAHDSEDGRFDDDPAYIESIAEWDGEVGVLTKTLAEVGFLDKDEKGYRMHGWDEHNGKDIKASVAKRGYQAQRRRERISGEAATEAPPVEKKREPRKPPTPWKPNVGITQQQKLVDLFYNLYMEARRSPYVVDAARDLSIISALVASVGAAEVAGRMHRFFEIPEDKWMAKVGYTIQTFKSQFNRLTKNAAPTGYPINPVRTA